MQVPYPLHWPHCPQVLVGKAQLPRPSQLDWQGGVPLVHAALTGSYSHVEAKAVVIAATSVDELAAVPWTLRPPPNNTTTFRFGSYTIEWRARASGVLPAPVLLVQVPSVGQIGRASCRG